MLEGDYFRGFRELEGGRFFEGPVCGKKYISARTNAPKRQPGLAFLLAFCALVYFNPQVFISENELATGNPSKDETRR